MKDCRLPVEEKVPKGLRILRDNTVYRKDHVLFEVNIVLALLPEALSEMSHDARASKKG